MGNLIGEMKKFYDSELSDNANGFINDNRPVWNRFIVQAKIAIRERDQKRMDKALTELAPYLDKSGGEPLWNELWAWIVKNNRKPSNNDNTKN